jgi:hypothetical protein
LREEERGKRGRREERNGRNDRKGGEIVSKSASYFQNTESFSQHLT